jgi:hypothetical protein
MRKALLILTFLAGGLSLLAIVGWSWLSLAAYGSLFGSMGAREIGPTLVLMLVCPLSLLPAGLVARKRPAAAGLWLTGSGVFTFFWFLIVVVGDGLRLLFQQSTRLEVGIPVALLSGVPLLLGSGFLWLSRSALVEALAPLRTPDARRRMKLLAAGAVSAFLILAVFWSETAPVWAVTVEPMGQQASTLRFTPKDAADRQDELSRLFSPLFSKVPATADPTTLGTVVLTRRDVRFGSTTKQTFSLSTTRNREGFLIVLLDQTPIDHFIELGRPLTPEEHKVNGPAALQSGQRHMVRMIQELAWRLQQGSKEGG